MTGEGVVSGVEYCAPGEPSNIMASHSSEIRSEIRRLEGQLGLNHWETQLGMNYFVNNSARAGKLNKLMGECIPKDCYWQIESYS